MMVIVLKELYVFLIDLCTYIVIIKTLCMSLKNVFLWVYLVSIPEDGVSSQIEFDMGWNCVEVFLRYSGS